MNMQPSNLQSQWPEIWLMTDKRNDHILEASIQQLPRGSGIIFRHYHLSEQQRAERFELVRKIARQRHHVLLLAGSPSLAKAWAADGVHGRQWSPPQTGGLLHSAPVHNVREIHQARKSGAGIFFLSPAFSTRSHPDQKSLNSLQIRKLIQLCNSPVILLGGMNARRFRQYQPLGAYGWAAIDSLSP